MVRLTVVAVRSPLALSAGGGKSKPEAAPSTASSSSGGGASQSSRSSDRALVRLLDNCDPATFNLSPPHGVGPHTCVVGTQDGFTPFGAFIAELQATKVADAREFDEDKAEVAAGQTLSVRNEEWRDPHVHPGSGVRGRHLSSALAQRLTRHKLRMVPFQSGNKSA